MFVLVVALLDMLAQTVRALEGFDAEVTGERAAGLGLPCVVVVVVFLVVVIIVVLTSSCCSSRLVPPSVRGQIGGTVENFVALGTPVLHVHYHGAPGKYKQKSRLFTYFLSRARVCRYAGK